MAFAACSNKEICHKTLTAQCINQAWCPHSGGTCEVPLSFHPLIMCMRVNGGGGWCVSSFQAALLTLTFHYIYDFTTADLKKKEKKVEETSGQMLKSYLGVCFTLVNHDLHCEPWRHLCADNSLKQITKKYIKKNFWFQKLTFKRRSRGRSLQTRAHLPLNRIHPANTRGQRWQAWRMRAALSRRRGSTWGNESDEMLPAAHAEINNKKNDFAFILSSTEQISSVCPLYCLHVSCRHTK